MKNALIVLFSAVTLAIKSQSLDPQTNIYTTTLLANPKTDATCAGGHYWYVAHGTYIGPGSVVSNKWFYPTTNIHMISFTNNDALISYVSSFGDAACGHGQLTWTNDTHPTATYRFSINWSNNVVPVPTNGEPVPLTTFGFRTNAP